MIDYSNEERYQWMYCDVFIANCKQVRPEGQTQMIFWKNRRNGKIALAKRLREGKHAEVLLDTKTLDLVTDFQIQRNYRKDAVIVPSENSSKRKKLPKAVRYARINS